MRRGVVYALVVVPNDCPAPGALAQASKETSESGERGELHLRTPTTGLKLPLAAAGN